MVKVKYIDHEGAADAVEAFGVKFKAGKSTDVDADIAARLKGNHFFEVQTGAAKDTKEPPLDPNGNPPSNEAPSEDILEAVHRGRGVYAVVRGEDVLKEGLTKEDAETFNALSDEDKAAKLAEQPTE